MGAGGNIQQQTELIRLRIRDCIDEKSYGKTNFLEISGHQTVLDLFCKVSLTFHYTQSSIDLVYIYLTETGSEIQVSLLGQEQKLLEEAFEPSPARPIEILLVNIDNIPVSHINHPSTSGSTAIVNDNDVDMSATPLLQSHAVPNAPATTPEIGKGIVADMTGNLTSQNSCHFSSDYNYSYKPETGYVGLVNQAMTCYMNSLFQTLYMTPEFRNALYHWEFDGVPDEAVKSIPYQLQKLFIQLQTSKDRAVKTTDVTKSFGWDNSDVWLQHDIQELCRVMFDALETKFKDTAQEHLINRLYQGRMRDYVRCLTCGHVSAREDTYLDIQLPIRPFGSSESYSSVEESLEAFIKPERLEDTNQYFCDLCKVKVDAVKGFSFQTFPYLLTLQLMRFAFDFNTLNRIKLNDKMTFPFELNLNRFIDKADEGPTPPSSMDVNHKESTDNNTVQDGGASNHTTSPRGDECVGENESLMGAMAGLSGSNKDLEENEGPYKYELFSIMVHSGSAIGGHYYAYIRSFTDGLWYCFNDQNVSTATEEEVKKTFGGSSSGGSGFRGFSSSSMYTSSTNAYMLMYRKIDGSRNVGFTDEKDCPQHINNMIRELRAQEHKERLILERDQATCKIKVYCKDPRHEKLVSKRLEVHKDKTFSQAINMTHSLFCLEGVVELEDCRLVKYDEYHEAVESSFENCSDTSMEVVLGGVRAIYTFDLLLEIKRPGQAFSPYTSGGVTLKVMSVDLLKECVSSPVNVQVMPDYKTSQIKLVVAKAFDLPPEFSDKIWVVEEPRSRISNMRCLCMADDIDPVPFENSSERTLKIFIDVSDQEPQSMSFAQTKLFAFLDKYKHTIKVTISLPLHSDVVDYIDLVSQESQDDDEEQSVDMDTGSNSAVMDPPAVKLSPPGGSTSSPASKDSGSSECPTLVDTSRTGSQVSLAALDGDHAAQNWECGDASSMDMDCGTPAGSPRDHLALESDLADLDQGSQEWQAGQDAETASGGLEFDAEDGPAEENMFQPGGFYHGPCGDLVEENYPPGQDLKKEKYRGVSDDFCKPPEEDSAPPDYNTAVLAEDANRFCVLQEPVIGALERIISARIDKRMTLSGLKKRLEVPLQLSSDFFKVFRVTHSNQEVELVNTTETFSTLSEDTKLNIKLGRILKKDEVSLKIFLFDIDDPKTSEHQLDIIIHKLVNVNQLKRKLSRQISRKFGLKVPIDRMRVRRRFRQGPGSTCLDASLIVREPLPLYPTELVLQILRTAQDPDNDSVSQRLVFLRRWRPSTLTWDDRWDELVLESSLSVSHLDQTLTAVTALSGDLPREHIELAKTNVTFPADMSVLDVQSTLDWQPSISNKESLPSGGPQCPIISSSSDVVTSGSSPTFATTAPSNYYRSLTIHEDGTVLFYRDGRETVKALTSDERKQLEESENTRLGRSNRTYYSGSTFAKKERALKIYIDDGSAPTTSN